MIMTKKGIMTQLINESFRIFVSNDFNCKLEDFFYCDCRQTPYVLTFRLYKLPTYSLCYQLNKNFNRVALDVISENEVYVRIQDDGLPF